MNFKRLPETNKKYTPAEEQLILERARTDLHVFSHFYTAYAQRIYNYCLRRVTQSEEAEDLTSLIFTRAMTGLKGYRGGSAAAWIFQIAHNAVVDHLRNRPTRLSFDNLSDHLLAGNLTNSEESSLPLDLLLKQEQQKQLLELIGHLGDEQRELLALSVAGELTAKEIGQILGKSEGAVRMALRRLFQQLRLSYDQAEAEGEL